MCIKNIIPGLIIKGFPVKIIGGTSIQVGENVANCYNSFNKTLTLWYAIPIHLHWKSAFNLVRYNTMSQDQIRKEISALVEQYAQEACLPKLLIVGKTVFHYPAISRKKDCR